MNNTKIKILASFVFSSLFGFSQNQIKSLPHFKSDAEKSAWILNHPDDYKRLSGEKVTNVIPEFKTQAEKDAWILQNKPNKKEALTQEQIESSISSEAAKDAYLQKQTYKVYISQEEFNALPEVKKASVLADKNFIIIK